MSRLKPHLQTPATWISLLALFVALGGTAYAAVKITGKNVVNSSLTGADIKNGSIGVNDLSASAKKSLAGKAGAPGANGAAGAAGAPGANGAAGAAGAPGANGTPGTNGMAVAFGGVSGIGSCNVDTARSFNLAATCTQPSPGVYRVTVTGGVDLDTPHVGTCTARGSNTAITCVMRFQSANEVDITTNTETNQGIWFAIY